MWPFPNKPAPIALPEPGMVEMIFGDKPTPFIVCTVMWFLHGFVLDILIIGVLPVLVGEKTASAMFYNGKLANLAPQHRRFIAENTAYAVMRIAPIFFTTSLPVLLITGVSYFVEAFTIASELIRYKCPSDAIPPMTLMCVFCSVVTYAATVDTDYLTADPMVLMALQVACGLTWATWLTGLLFAGSKKA